MNAVISVFIDLKKAFDAIDDTILLQKLNHYRTCEIVNQWASSYLSHRKQCVQFKETKSNLVSILCGVPPGSIHRPKLFNLYLNDICSVSIILEFTIFADNANIVTQAGRPSS